MWKEFVEKVWCVLGVLVVVLRECGGCFGVVVLWVLKIVKGGFLGWGIVFKGGCDFEFVIFFDCFKSYVD